MNHALHTAATTEQHRVAQRAREDELIRRQAERRAASRPPTHITWVTRTLHPIRTARVAATH